MSLPEGFLFSQNSLQDYTDCPRRFQLRYLLRQPWPAVQSEPVAEYERLLDRARLFHRLAQRHNLGMSDVDLARSTEDLELRRWWRNYLESPPPNLPVSVRRPEITLSAPLSDYRLIARYDLLAIDPGRRAMVVDWKTNKRRPDSTALATRLQTRVYRYVLVEAGTALNGGNPLPPDQVTMVYWFAEYPAEPEILHYDATLFGDDGAYLTELVISIANYAKEVEAEWPLTEDESRCRFCNYRSLCDRGVMPGPLADFDADQDLDISLEFDFEEIEEIEY